MVIIVRYNVEDPHFFDIKLYQFHVECHASGVALELIVR